MSKRKPPRAQAAPQPPATTPVTTPAGVLLLPFAAAIFTGALLLFLVQPLIARYVLPWFGGGPGVWATCMLFFQVLLLGGYLYAHLSVRLLPAGPSESSSSAPESSAISTTRSSTGRRTQVDSRSGRDSSRRACGAK